MVKELKRANDNNDENESISLKDMRLKAKESQIKIIKPALTKETDAIVKDVDIKLEMDKYEHNRGDESAVYHPGAVIVTTEFEHPETHEMVESKDFFSGFRAYLELDEELSPIIDKETGMEKIYRYLPGTTGQNKGGLRRFIEAVQSDMTEDEEEEYNDWLSFLLDFLPGQKVKIKSEFNTYNGKTTIKQAIVGLRR